MEIRKYFILKIVFVDFDFYFNFIIKLTSAIDHLLELIRKHAISSECLTMADTNLKVLICKIRVTKSYMLISSAVTAKLICGFLAHLSRRLTGELIVYPCSGVWRPSVHNFKDLLL